MRKGQYIGFVIACIIGLFPGSNAIISGIQCGTSHGSVIATKQSVNVDDPGIISAAQYEKARAEVNRLTAELKVLILRLKDADPAAWEELSKQFEKANTARIQHQEIIEQYQSTHHEVFAEVNGLFNDGNLNTRSGKYTDAIKIYDSVISEGKEINNPALKETISRAYFMKGICFVKLKNLTEATRAYQEAINIDPNNEKAFFNLGYVYRRQGKSQESINAFQSAVNVDPACKEAYYMMGNTFRRMKQYAKAIACFEQAVKIDEKYKRAIKALNLTYEEQNRYIIEDIKESDR